MAENTKKKPAPRKRAAKKETPRRTPRKRTASATPTPRKRRTATNPTPGTPAPAPTNGTGNANLWPLVAVVALIVAGVLGWQWLKDNDNGTTSVAPPVTVLVDPSVPPTATPMPPTATLPPETPTANEWVAFESEGGVPFNGSSINVDVAPDELEVITAGPVTVNGISLPGGYDRGSIVIFLPDTNVIHYTADNVIPGSNWHASYRPQSDPTIESTWMSLVDFTVANMFGAPNCSPGTGCMVVDILVVSPSGVIAQWTVSV